MSSLVQFYLYFLRFINPESHFYIEKIRDDPPVTPTPISDTSIQSDQIKIRTTNLIEAIRRKNQTAVRNLIENGANVNEKDGDGNLPIQIAIEKRK